MVALWLCVEKIYFVCDKSEYKELIKWNYSDKNTSARTCNLENEKSMK